jgi:hypothetical protein
MMTKIHKLLLFGVFAVALLALCCFATRALIRARIRAHEIMCFENIRVINAAIESCALANRWHEGDTIDTTNLFPMLLGNKLPICPDGGQYVIKTVGITPSCTVHTAMCARIRFDASKIVAKAADGLYLLEE